MLVECLPRVHKVFSSASSPTRTRCDNNVDTSNPNTCRSQEVRSSRPSSDVEGVQDQPGDTGDLFSVFTCPNQHLQTGPNEPRLLFPRNSQPRVKVGNCSSSPLPKLWRRRAQNPSLSSHSKGGYISSPQDVHLISDQERDSRDSVVSWEQWLRLLLPSAAVGGGGLTSSSWP